MRKTSTLLCMLKPTINSHVWCRNEEINDSFEADECMCLGLLLEGVIGAMGEGYCRDIWTRDFKKASQSAGVTETKQGCCRT